MNGLFSKGIDEIWQQENEDKTWQFFLHKVFNKSYEDFKAEQDEPQEMTVDDFEATYSNSKSMLQGFNPFENGVN